MLDAMSAVPAFVRNGRLDILGANRLGRALYSTALRQRGAAAEHALGSSSSILAPPPSTSTGSASRTTSSPSCARKPAAIRTTASSPTSSASCRRAASCSGRSWAAHNVRRHDTGVKRFQHPVVGEFDLTYEAMELAADPGLTMFVYTAEPGSKSEEALNLLASWTATPDQEETHADHEEQPRHQAGA